MLLKTKLAASLLIASALTTTPVLAGTEAGDGVVGGQISFTDSDTSETTSINVGGSMFITDAIELGLSAFISTTETSGVSGSTDFLAYSVRGTYNFFTDSNVVPFVGAGLAIQFIESGAFEDDFAVYDVFGGVRFFVAENVALRVELRDSSAVDSDDNFDQTSFLGGIELFF